MRTRRLAIIASLLLCALLGVSGAAANEATDADIKAAYLYYFAKLIRWPEEEFSEERVFVFAVMGNRELSKALREIAKEKTIDGCSLKVTDFRYPWEFDKCHVLFIDPSVARYSNRVLSKARYYSTLTVSEAPGFLQAGGMVNFFHRSQRVKFGIATRPAEESRLEIPAQLLRVAAYVEQEHE